MARRKTKKAAQLESVRVFARNLRETRSARGFTQAEVAHRSETNEAYLGRLERGESEPGIDVAVRIAKALGVTIGDLFPDDTSKSLAVQKEQATKLFNAIMNAEDQNVILLLNPLLRLLVDKSK